MRDEPWCIVDTETTGLYPPVFAVEIAAQRMKGWEREGEPFRVLLNHDVPIEPAAEALHGYSRQYLRQHGMEPRTAHALFRQYGVELPLVAYNLSYDWDRVLAPEYQFLGVPPTGTKGFCAMTLSRRTINGTLNYKLETLKEHFQLSINRSHRGRDDVEVLARLCEIIIAPRLKKAGICGFSAVASFSRETPVARCLEQVLGAGDAVWYYVDSENKSCGPFTAPQIRTIMGNEGAFVWREGMPDWSMSTNLPEFAPVVKKPRERKKREKPAVAAPSGNESQESVYKAHYSRWVDEIIGLCRGILADNIVNEREVVALRDWLVSCPCTHLYPISVVAQHVESIVSDGLITPEELEDLRQTLAGLMPITP